MKKSISILILATISLVFFLECKKDDKDNTPLFAGLVLLNQRRGSSASITYSNSTTGSSQAIAGSTSSTSAASSATSSATQSATSAATNILSNSVQDVSIKASESLGSRVPFQDSTTCNGTTKTATGSYKTAFTSTAGSGSYTVTPNITASVTYSCTYSSSSNYTFNGTSTITGSLSVTFTNATITYFDIDSFVKNGTIAFKSSTLTGTITVSNINQSFSENRSYLFTTSGSTSKYNLTSNGSYSDSVATSNLVVDGASASTLSLTETALYNFVLNSTSTITGSTYSTCYNTFSADSGGAVSGTYNSSAVSTSYALTSDNYKKYLAALNLTVTMCQ